MQNNVDLKAGAKRSKVFKKLPKYWVMCFLAILAVVSIGFLGCSKASTSKAYTTVSNSTITTQKNISQAKYLNQAAAKNAAATTTAIPKGVHGKYVVLAWNDLGMHCYNNDFKDIAILPPYNNLWAQVIMQGEEEPHIVTKGITVSFKFPENTYSAGKKSMPDKTNFWSYAQKIFGLSKPLPVNVGLKGNGLSGTMKLASDHFVAEGIPLTEYRDQDAAKKTRYPYQRAVIEVRQAGTGTLLARTIAVAPVSTEMHCDRCHNDKGIATKNGKITPTGKVETNILALHDKRNSKKYASLGFKGTLMGNRPVLCASCHGSNALGTKSKGKLPSLSNAIHNRHAGVKDITNDINGCYNCHPGPQTKCLRDVHYTKFKMDCVSCHGTLRKVSKNPNPWLNEPRCDNSYCHHNVRVAQNKPLYKNSKAHGGIYCEGCHDSTHAIAPSREANDAIKFVDLQGKNGTLNKCSVCHTSKPDEKFNHRGD